MHLVSIASAQATRPATAPVADSYEDQLIHKAAVTSKSPTTRDADGNLVSMRTKSSGTGLVDLRRVVMALAVVLGLIFALRWLGKRFFPSAIGGRAAGVVRVLTRSPVAPKQQVLLLQVGKRVLVVADNGTQLNALSEISEPDEVAQLIGEITNSSSRSAAREEFDAELGKAEAQYDAKLADEGASDPSPAQEVRDESMSPAQIEISGLMEKARLLAKQLGRS